MVAHLLAMAGWSNLSHVRALLREARDIALAEIRDILHGFLEHAWPAKLYMLILVAAATALTCASLSLLAGAVLLADHSIFVAIMGAYIGLLAGGFWHMLRSFAHFRKEAWWLALATSAQFAAMIAIGWLFRGRPVWLGLAGLSWLALAVQSVVYLIRDRGRWGARERERRGNGNRKALLRFLSPDGPAAARMGDPGTTSVRTVPAYSPVNAGRR